MPDTHGILRQKDFDTEQGLEEQVEAMMASLAPAMISFAAQKGVDIKGESEIYSTLAWSERYIVWSERYTGGQMDYGVEIDVRKQIDIYPAKNWRGSLRVKVMPSASIILLQTLKDGQAQVCSYRERGRITQPSEEALLASLEQAYQSVRSIQPHDITHQETALVIA